VKDITERFFEGDRRALARVLSRIESGNPTGREYMRELYPRSGNAHTIGITGGAGSGKSTLTGALAAEYRRRDFKVGIVAVDPSSPFSQGAILGDRIRMQSLILDPGVFVRSMASRGTLGGLAPTIDDVIAAMDAFGFEYILVETVGAGQDEVEIAGSALTTILVNNPGTGDDIQAMKAGIIEVADILVVNKSDLPGADMLASQLKALLSLAPPAEYEVPLLSTIATRGEGMIELADAVDNHRAYLDSSGMLQIRRKDDARHQILSIAQRMLLEHVRTGSSESKIEALVDEVAKRALDPHTAAAKMVADSVQ
jgi:LAO/AO transport system kinase